MQADSAGHNTESNVVNVSWHAGTGKSRGTHLYQDTVKPLQWSIEMDLDPARRAGYCLPPNNKQTSHCGSQQR